MKQSALIGATALLIGLGGGYGFAQINDATANTENQHEHSVDESHDANDDKMSHDDTEGQHAMEHKMFVVTEDKAPSVSLSVTEDEKSGWNVRIDTQRFTFAPQSVNGENSIGEGHAHLYIDGEKIARLYGPNFHYDGSFDGTKTFKVTLNANDHSEYAVGDEVISAEQAVMHESHQ
jgi:hypothetical protein